MKKLLIVTCLTCALTVVVHAAEGETKKEEAKAKRSVAAEQKAIRKELVEKYDINKNSRLDKAERSKMTPEDLEKWNDLAAAARKRVEAAKEKAAEKKGEGKSP